MKGAKRKPRRYRESFREIWKHYPGSQSTLYYGFPAYSVARTVFVVYVSSDSEVLRLTRRRVEELTLLGIGTVFGTPRGMWPEWLMLDLGWDYPVGEYVSYFNEAYYRALGRKPEELIPDLAAVTYEGWLDRFYVG